MSHVQGDMAPNDDITLTTADRKPRSTAAVGSKVFSRTRDAAVSLSG